jgi:hypothetical protein
VDAVSRRWRVASLGDHRVNATPMSTKHLPRDETDAPIAIVFIDSKPKFRLRAAGEIPLSGTAASCP